MIEFKSLHNRFLIHQALVAAAAANVLNNSPNFLNTSTTTTTMTQNENLEINTSPSAYTASTSSVSSSPIFNNSPTRTSTDTSVNKCIKRKLVCQNESVPFAKRTNTSRGSSSFLISDILGLDKETDDENEEIIVTDDLKSETIYNQYQSNLQQSYYSALAQSELFRLIANSNKLNEVKNVEKRELSPIPHATPPPSISKPKKCANGILSSLERLTRDQFQDDFNFNTIHSQLKKSTPAIKQEAINNDENKSVTPKACSEVDKPRDSQKNGLLPAWVYCTRYSDRPSAG